MKRKLLLFALSGLLAFSSAVPAAAAGVTADLTAESTEETTQAQTSGEEAAQTAETAQSAAAQTAAAADGASTVLNVDDTEIAIGVYAGDINLSNMTQEEAGAALDAYVEGLESRKITIKTADHENTLSAAHCQIELPSKDTIIEDALTLGKSGNLIARFKDLAELSTQHKVYDLDITFNETRLKNYISKKLSRYNSKPVEPAIKLTDGKFVVSGGDSGITVEEDQTFDAVKKALIEDTEGETALVDAVIKEVKPKHAKEELEVIQDLMGQKTTSYNRGQVGRTKSLELSTSRINGTIVWPGETISASTLMGPRTVAGGYGTGQGYFGTEIEETVGAGICQTASTLYNAALFAELDVIERHHHSMIVHYVDYAMDSTIYAGSDYKNPSKDLKLRNPYDYPIYIWSNAYGGRCTFRIYGKETRPKNREVKYKSTTVSYSWPEPKVVYDSSQYEGYVRVEGTANPHVVAYLTKYVYVDGKQVEKTKLHTDSYKGSSKTRIVGSRKKPVETKPAKETQKSEDNKPVETTKAEEGQAGGN
ncbi:MAG: VanW family protein [Lachnospiraceae bacterium]